MGATGPDREASLTPAVETYLAEVLGPVELLRVHTRRSARTIEVASLGDGQRWVAKTITSETLYRNEVTAYSEWVHRLADQAPRLHHTSPALRTLILTWLPGGTCDYTFNPRDHRRAGRLLGRIHAAAPPVVGGVTLGEELEGTLERVVRRYGNVLTPREIEIAATAVRWAHHVPSLPVVPSHGDYTGNNWVRGPQRMRVIDFALAGWRVAATDFTRLSVGSWWDRPHLRDAFLEGYGQALSDTDREVVRLHMPVLLLGQLGHSRVHGDAVLERRRAGRLEELGRQG